MELAIVTGEISRRASATLSVDKLEPSGGAAVYRCDLGLNFAGFTACGKTPIRTGFWEGHEFTRATKSLNMCSRFSARELFRS
jgi:hypothetical protein